MREVHLSCPLPGCAAYLQTLARLLKACHRQPTGHTGEQHVLEGRDISGAIPLRLQVPVPTRCDY